MKKRKRTSRKRPVAKDILGQLFGSETRARLLRVFLCNPSDIFSLREASRKVKASQPSVMREMRRLKKVGLVREKLVKAGPRSKKRVFFANTTFPLFTELQALVGKTSHKVQDDLKARIGRLGRVQLAILSGVFTGDENAKADLLLVGVKLNKRKVNSLLGDLEAEVGRAINCVVLDLKEFRYRWDLYDRFLRDMLESKNIRLIGRLKI